MVSYVCYFPPPAEVQYTKRGADNNQWEYKGTLSEVVYTCDCRNGVHDATFALLQMGIQTGTKVWDSQSSTVKRKGGGGGTAKPAERIILEPRPA